MINLKRLMVMLFLLLGLGVGTAFANGGATLNVEGEELEVYALQKSGNDNENFVILFFGDGYTTNEQNKFLEHASRCAKTLLCVEPFKSYSDKINIYAIPTISEESGVSVKDWDENVYEKNTYFHIIHRESTTSFSKDGEDKARRIRKELEKSYLDSGAGVGTIHILSNSDEFFGTSTSALFSYASAKPPYYSGGIASVHEIAHSIGRIRDEYGYVIKGANTSKSSDRDTVPWKKLLGFRGVGITSNQQYDYSFIPTLSCNMLNVGSEFCEVCREELAKYINSKMYMKSPDEYYIAEPDVTIEHNDETSIGRLYDKVRINERNILLASRHNVEFRTIVINFSNKEKRFKMTFAITDKNGVYKYSDEKEFVVPPAVYYDEEIARVSLSVVLENVTGIKIDDKLDGKVIDCDTGEVVVTDKEKVLGEVRVNYKIKNEDGSITKMPNTYTTTIYAPIGTYTPKPPKQLNGYTYTGKSAGSITVTENGAEVDFYYWESVGTKTTLSEDGKTFFIKPYNIERGNTIILALYDGKKLKEAKAFLYDGNTITHTTKEDYSNAKVMAWESMLAPNPLCEAEDVK